MLYSRDDLTHVHEDADGYVAPVCGLCGAYDIVTPEDHEKSCVLRSCAVTHVEVIGHVAVVKFARKAAWPYRWWWTGPSGMEYHIELLPHRYVLADSPGNTMTEKPRLSDIRKFIKDNQGRL